MIVEHYLVLLRVMVISRYNAGNFFFVAQVIGRATFMDNYGTKCNKPMFRILKII